MYTDRQLLDMAKNAMKYSYSPYSHFAVGACVLMKDGSVFTGCIFKAVSEGHSDFDRIAVVSSSGEKTYPCGICRQVMSEFFHGDERIITEDKDGIYSYDINALLPYAFKL